MVMTEADGDDESDRKLSSAHNSTDSHLALIASAFPRRRPPQPHVTVVYRINCP